MEKTLKNEIGGITLIALVITIIVLLILAGITINSIFDSDNAMSKAQEARIKNERGDIADALGFDVVNIKLNNTENKNVEEFYKDKETFIEASKHDTNANTIVDYSYSEENRVVTLKIKKNGGIGTVFTFEIEIDTGKITCITDEENDSEEEVIVESNPGYFTYSTPDAEGNVTITGLTKGAGSGEEAYENDAEDIINLVIPKTVEINDNACKINKIGSNAFEGRSKIRKVVLQDNIIEIKAKVFTNCTSLTDLTIPITIYPHGETGYPSSFSGCTAISKVKLTVGKDGNGIGVDYQTVSNDITYNKYTTTPWYISEAENIEVEFEEGITQIGAYMFKECNNLQMVTLPSTIKTIGANAFEGCTGMKGEIKLIDGIESIGDSAFSGCTGLTGTLKIPTGMSSISSNTFLNCQGITQIIIPSNITEIKARVFTNCTSLADLTIPITIYPHGETGSQSSFSGCTAISRVKLTVGKDGNGIGVDYQAVSNDITYNKYKTTPWYISRANPIKIIIEKGITRIGNYTFYGQTNATYYYTGNETDWQGIDKGSYNGDITISQFNYKE